MSILSEARMKLKSLLDSPLEPEHQRLLDALFESASEEDDKKILNELLISAKGAQVIQVWGAVCDWSTHTKNFYGQEGAKPPRQLISAHKVLVWPVIHALAEFDRSSSMQPAD